VTRRRIVSRWVAVLAAGSLLLAGCSSPNVDAGSFTFTSPGGKTVFDYPVAERGTIGAFSGPNLTGDGSTISKTDYRGQVLVINYWGSWCDPCREELDDFNLAYDLTKDLGVAFLGINVAETRQNGLDFVVDNKVPYPSISDQGRRTLVAFRGVPANVTPVTMILDREQRVARVFLGGITLDQLAPAIKAVAAEPSAAAPSAAAQPGSTQPGSTLSSTAAPTS